ncbi:MAG: CapA family protein [Mycobacteriales bacterium]
MMRWRLAVVAALVAGCSTAAPPSGKSTPPTSVLPPSPSPSASAGPARDLTLAFAGDVHFAGRVESRLTTHPRDVLGPIGATLAAADIGMVNLESAVTERGTPEPKQFHFRAPASALVALHEQGIDVLTMANNHGVDYGPTGLRDSLAAIQSTHVPVIGIGVDAAHAYAPYRATVRGTRVAILAASQVQDRTIAAWSAGDSSPGIASAFQVDRLVGAVRAARASADVVVVYLHWGTEGDECPTAIMRSIAGKLAAAGATAVVGTHAHLLLGAGWLGQTYVAYGLGNFLWWRDNAYSNDTGVLTLRLRANRVVTAQLTPAHIDSAGVPQPAAGSQADRIRAKFAGLDRCSRLSAAPAG